MFYRPTHAEAYLCTPLQLDKENTYYITGFEPTANMKTAHHMLLYGCKSPGRSEAIFNCGAMAIKEKNYTTSLQPCGSGQQVVYAWAKNAPELDLPEGVGFRVGGPDSEIDWLVLQVNNVVLCIIGIRRFLLQKFVFRFTMPVWILFLKMVMNLE